MVGDEAEAPSPLRYPGGEEDARDELFAQLYSFRQSGFAIGASTFMRADDARERALEGEARALGLQVPHAYGVLEVHGAVGDEGARLVKLRNPNGHAGWRGPWSIGGRGSGTRSALASRG